MRRREREEKRPATSGEREGWGMRREGEQDKRTEQEQEGKKEGGRKERGAPLSILLGQLRWQKVLHQF